MACVRRQFNDSNNFVGSPIEKKKKNPNQGNAALVC